MAGANIHAVQRSFDEVNTRQHRRARREIVRERLRLALSFERKMISNKLADGPNSRDSYGYCARCAQASMFAKNRN